MAKKKPVKQKSRVEKPAPTPKPAAKPKPRGYTSAAWERVYLMSLELAAFTADPTAPEANEESEGFGLPDASHELTRLAQNYNGDTNPDPRTLEQETQDWVRVGGIGADLGNMAEETSVADDAEGVRAIAHELCYLACDYLF